MYETNDEGGVELAEDDFEFEAYAPQHNIVNELDVNGDGAISPIDALITINELNNPVVSSVRAIDHTDNDWFTDTNDDGIVAPLDAILVINALNANAGVGVSQSAALSAASAASAASVTSMASASSVSSATLTDLAFAFDGTEDDDTEDDDTEDDDTEDEEE